MVMPISQSSALLRSRLAGRQQPGKCFRLYPQKAQSEWPAMIQPEIKTLHLHWEITGRSPARGLEQVQKGVNIIN